MGVMGIRGPVLAIVILLSGQAGGEEEARIKDAVDRGRRWLVPKVRELLKEVEAGTSKTAIFELGIYTLLACGLPGKDPAMEPLLAELGRRPLQTTYGASLEAMALRKLDPEKFLPRIAECAQFLVDLQCDNGQWGYGRPASELKPRENPGNFRVPLVGREGSKPLAVVRRSGGGGKSGDNSNSHFAALGIRACLEAGIGIERSVLIRARAWWNRCQKRDGSWSYSGGEGSTTEDGPSGSMTSSGIVATCIYKHFLGEDFTRNASIQKGWEWLEREYTVKENPGHGNVGHFYYLYSLERAGTLLGRESMGEHGFRSEGVDLLLAHQDSDGHWGARDLLLRDAVTNTCLALLFLSRDLEPLPASHRFDPPAFQEHK
jgi:hypothetical protein